MEKSNLVYRDIPQRYKKDLDRISSETIKNIYSNFSFLYLELNSNNTNKRKIEELLASTLQQPKFLVYKIDLPCESELVKAIICIEKKCIIIESIDINLLEKIVKLSNPDYINASNPITEVQNFIKYSHFSDFNVNNFVKYTFNAIMGFLIKRYFYPTKYFKDPSFFVFNYSQEEEEKQKEINKKLEEKILNEYEFNENRFDLIKNHINTEPINNATFAESDFIEIDKINSNTGTYFCLAIHVKTLYLFLLKKINQNESQHEIEFCEKYSHRCMTKFYGLALYMNLCQMEH